MIDFTTVIGIDTEHLEELRLVWPTWREYRPELLTKPMLFVCDGARPAEEWKLLLAFVDHPAYRVVTWHMEGVSQREKMLTGLVLEMVQHVQTPWYLKLDTDVVASSQGKWVQSKWFSPDESGRIPVFVSSPWGYTKPPDAIQQLDVWAESIPELQGHPPLRIHPEPGANLVQHPRIISWCFFGNTEWTRKVSSYCDRTLPVPSQDTFLWYCAQRKGEFYRRVRMSRFGWKHIGSRKRLRKECQAVSKLKTEEPSTIHRFLAPEYRQQLIAEGFLPSIPAGEEVESKIQHSAEPCIRKPRLCFFVVKPSGADYADFSLPFTRDYCARHQYPLTVIETSSSDPTDLSMHKFAAHNMQPNCHVVILDADVVPLPFAPAFHEAADLSRMGLVPLQRPHHKVAHCHSVEPSRTSQLFSSSLLSSPARDASFFESLRQRLLSLKDKSSIDFCSELRLLETKPNSLDFRWNWSITDRFNPAKSSHEVWFVRYAGNPQARREKYKQLWEYWYGNHTRSASYIQIVRDLVASLKVSARELRGAEIGVAGGGLSAALLGCFPNLRLSMIDAWTTYPHDHPYARSGDGHARLSHGQQNEIMAEALWRTEYAAARRKIIRDESSRAAQTFSAKTLDFAFIDADHSYEGCVADLNGYYPTVRSGGLLMGHDYGHRRFSGVKQAVDEFTARHGLALKVEGTVWSTTIP